ncbi:MAG: hypothetical protein ABSG46_11325 [Candidatus Binataceae bacterium]
MAEENSSTTTETTANRETLERRLDRLEQEYLRENRWWRGGLIGALVLVAIAIMVSGFHHRPPPRGFGPMAMDGPMAMARPMGYPPPPPYWGYGWGYGCDRQCVPGEWRWRPWGGPGGPGGDPNGGPGAGPAGPPAHPSDG